MTKRTLEKIFGIGLPKTGTMSLHRALQILGIDSVHYPINDIIPAMQEGRYESMTNHEAYVNCGEWHFPALQREYPESRFICTWREFDKWILSMSRHFSRYASPKRGSAPHANRLEVFGTTVFDSSIMENIYWAHKFSVERYFLGHENFLLLNVEHADAFQKLCDFLGRPRTEQPFPHENAG